MTGWKITDSKGQEYKSYMNAAKAYAEDPTLTFEVSEFDMAGSYHKDITDEVKGFYERYIKNKGM